MGADMKTGHKPKVRKQKGVPMPQHPHLRPLDPTRYRVLDGTLSPAPTTPVEDAEGK